MKLAGIKDLLAFLEFLSSRNVWFKLEQCRYDSIMVTFTLVGVRVEVDFFEDHIEYSVFRGSEEVLQDEDALIALIREQTDE